MEQTMSDKAIEARRAAGRRYREAHREEINAYARAWRAANKDKVKRNNARYWERKAAEERDKPV